MGRKLLNACNLYLEGIRDGKYIEAVNAYTGDRYIQHSTGVKDGREGFIEFFKSFVERNPDRKIEIIRGLEDGQYVFLHVFQSLNNGGSKWVTTDFFDTDENDLIVEHWDVISPYCEYTPSGHTSIDGPTEILDLEKTEENKTLVRNLITEALIPGGDPHHLERYISKENYIQHHNDVPDGLAVFQQLAASQDRLLHYRDLVLLVGQGNYVASLCRATGQGDNTLQEFAQVDIFRVEKGKLVEHWDNVEPVPTVSVNKGKF